MVCLPDVKRVYDVFSCFERISSCVGHTELQTDGQTYILPLHSRAVKVREKIAIFDQYLAVSPKRYHRRRRILFRQSSHVEQLVVIDAECTFVAGISAAVEMRTFPSLLRLLVLTDTL